MRFLTLISLASVSLTGAAFAADAPYNSATISGLGARNIGSATMSGRISALAAIHEPSGKLTIFVGAASGGVWKSEDGGTHYRPIFDEQSSVYCWCGGTANFTLPKAAMSASLGRS